MLALRGALPFEVSHGFVRALALSSPKRDRVKLQSGGACRLGIIPRVLGDCGARVNIGFQGFEGLDCSDPMKLPGLWEIFDLLVW
jgi:hypothetical protein